MDEEEIKIQQILPTLKDYLKFILKKENEDKEKRDLFEIILKLILLYGEGEFKSNFKFKSVHLSKALNKIAEEYKNKETDEILKSGKNVKTKLNNLNKNVKSIQCSTKTMTEVLWHFTKVGYLTLNKNGDYTVAEKLSVSTGIIIGDSLKRTPNDSIFCLYSEVGKKECKSFAAPKIQDLILNTFALDSVEAQICFIRRLRLIPYKIRGKDIETFQIAMWENIFWKCENEDKILKVLSDNWKEQIDLVKNNSSKFIFRDTLQSSQAWDGGRKKFLNVFYDYYKNKTIRKNELQISFENFLDDKTIQPIIDELESTYDIKIDSEEQAFKNGHIMLQTHIKEEDGKTLLLFITNIDKEKYYLQLFPTNTNLNLMEKTEGHIETATIF